MPGIFGIVNADGAAPAASAQVARMRDILRHHDSYKDYLFESQGCALGGSTAPYFNAIVQPAFSGNRNLCLAMEGEIFNGEELRADLKSQGHNADAANDAELMMRLYEADASGLAHKVNGLFILAVWNGTERSLTLINDRVGLHYLYYRLDGSHLAFAPEMKALLCDPKLERKVDPESVADFFTFGSVFGSRTFLCGVKVMPPGTIMEYRDGKLTLQNYWDFPLSGPTNGNSKRAYIEELDHVFQRVIKRQTRDRCRYGLALSGGRDSRVLAGYLGDVVTPLNTFTFGDPATDEVKFARKVSDIVGGRYHHVHDSDADLTGSFEKVVWLTEGPINTPEYYLLGKALSESVDVAFNGHGGDVLGGRWVTRALGRTTDMAPVKTETFARYSRRLGDHVPSKFFSENYYPLVDGAAQRNFFAAFAGLQAEAPYHAQLKHEMRTKNWREYTRVIDVPRFFVRYRYPFFDYEVLDFFLKLPHPMRLNERVYLGVLLEKFPRLADIPYPNRRFSLRAEQRYLRPYYKLRNQLGHFMVDRFYKRLSRIAPLSAVSHVDEAYRGPSGHLLQAMLLEGNCKHGYFNQQYLDAIIKAHINRDADHSFLLHKLVTFELFHTLLVDPDEIGRPTGNLL